MGRLGERRAKRLGLGAGVGCSARGWGGVVHLKPTCFGTNVTQINSIKNEAFISNDWGFGRKGCSSCEGVLGDVRRGASKALGIL